MRNVTREKTRFLRHPATADAFDISESDTQRMLATCFGLPCVYRIRAACPHSCFTSPPASHLRQGRLPDKRLRHHRSHPHPE
jgi:hypothetical protein